MTSSDLKASLLSGLGYDLNTPLISLNIEAIQGILIGITRKLQEYSSRFDRLEYETEAKANKSEVNSIKEKMKSFLIESDLIGMIPSLDDRATKIELEEAFHQIERCRENQEKLETMIRTKASKHDYEVIQEQIAYVNEAIGNHDQELVHIKTIRQQINKLASTQGKGTVQEAMVAEEIEGDRRELELRFNEISSHVEVIEDKIEELEELIKNIKTK